MLLNFYPSLCQLMWYGGEFLSNDFFLDFKSRIFKGIEDFLLKKTQKFYRFLLSIPGLLNRIFLRATKIFFIKNKIKKFCRFLLHIPGPRFIFSVGKYTSFFDFFKSRELSLTCIQSPASNSTLIEICWSVQCLS